MVTRESRGSTAKGYASDRTRRPRSWSDRGRIAGRKGSQGRGEEASAPVGIALEGRRGRLEPFDRPAERRLEARCRGDDPADDRGRLARVGPSLGRLKAKLLEVIVDDQGGVGMHCWIAPFCAG